MDLGMVGALMFPMALLHLCGFSWLVFASGALLGGFLTGAAIEIVQRVGRKIKKRKQNTIEKSILDMLITGLWFLRWLK